MMQHSLRAPLTFAFGCMLAGCGPAQPAAGAGEAGSSEGEKSAQQSGPRAPDFSLPELRGGTFNLSEVLGEKVILINFWSTTCDPCMIEMPHLVEMYEKNKDRGLLVLAISLDGPESLAQVQSVVHDKRMTFPVLLDEETMVVSRYNPKRDLPFSVIIDKSGAIVDKRAGYTPGDERSLEEKVERLLQ